MRLSADECRYIFLLRLNILLYSRDLKIVKAMSTAEEIRRSMACADAFELTPEEGKARQAVTEIEKEVTKASKQGLYQCIVWYKSSASQKVILKIALKCLRERGFRASLSRKLSYYKLTVSWRAPSWTQKHVEAVYNVLTCKNLRYNLNENTVLHRGRHQL